MAKSKKSGAEQTTPAQTAEERKAAKRQRFERLAVKRVRKALRALEHVRACGNRQNYSYSEDEAGKIISAIKDKVSEICSAYSTTDNGESPSLFNL